jgi:hypothetical protein
MLDNLARQQAAYLKSHGVPMSPSHSAHALATMLALQSLYFEDSESAARPEFNSESFYKSIAPASSIDPRILSQRLAASAAARSACQQAEAPSCSSSRGGVVECGFAIGCAPTPRIADICAEMYLIQQQLLAARLPPQFVFVFNAAWELLDYMWETAANDVLGEGSVMEASCTSKPSI